MSAAVNKRQQARNERTLQDLIKNVPGNDKCADCGANNPGWASWSLGIFLCMRCAALHRKLGTHISKVKSLSMDSWGVEQVENMKRIGNFTSNKQYNPRNVRAAIPIDIDEVDGVMERFIRQKYEQKSLGNQSPVESRHHTGSTSSDERPPPLPPKPNKHSFRFGLRSATANIPFVRHNERSPPLSPVMDSFSDRAFSSPRNKPAKIFGADVGGSRDDNIKIKLAQLKDMGFPDEKRNLTVLKGLNGNIDRAVEELIRLGEGGSSSRTSNTPRGGSPRKDSSNGLFVEKTRPPALTTTRNGADAFDTQKSLPPSPISTADSGTVQSMNEALSPNNPFNPFLMQQQQAAPVQQPQQQQPPQAMQSQGYLDQSFQNLSLSQTQSYQAAPQQLFPNTTGGYGTPALPGHNPFLQTYTPPPMPNGHSAFATPPPFAPPVQAFDPFPQSQSPQQQLQPGQGVNPFLRTSRSQVFAPSNPFGAQHPLANGTTLPPQTSPFAPLETAQPVQAYQPSPYLGQSNGASPFDAQTPTARTVSNPFQQVAPQQTGVQAQQQPMPFQSTYPFQSAPQASQPLVSSPLAQPASSPFAQPTTSPFAQPAAMPFAPQTASPFTPQTTSSFAQPATSPFAQQPVQPPQPFQPSASPFAPQPTGAQTPQPFQPHHANTFPITQTTTSPPPQLSQQGNPSPFALPARHDKSSILALYGMPHLAPARTGIPPAAGSPEQQPQQPLQRSATMPAALMQSAGPQQDIVPQAPQQYNPFAAFGPQADALRHISRESVAFAGFGGVAGNGRHSPDAFADLSWRGR